MDRKIPFLPDEEEKRNGRPPAAIDADELLGLCRVHATNTEIAAYFKVSVRTIERLKKKPELAAFMEHGRAGGKISLRRAQWKKALGGNVTMQIWLGKQELDQRDRFEVSGPKGGPIAIKQLLETLSDEEYGTLAREAGLELPDDEPLAEAE